MTENEWDRLILIFMLVLGIISGFVFRDMMLSAEESIAVGSANEKCEGRIEALRLNTSAITSRAISCEVGLDFMKEKLFECYNKTPEEIE